MSFQRVHRSNPQNSQTLWSNSEFAPRPFPVQQPKRPPTQEEIENQAFEQNKFEASELQFKEQYGTITPIEQENLGVLQAKMNGFWAHRMERASRFDYNFATIPVHHPNTQVSVAPIQPKLTIGQLGDRYEQEGDRVAEQVMRMPDRPSSNHGVSFSSVDASTAQRKRKACEEKKLQRKDSGSTAETPATVPPVVHEVLNSPGQPLDPVTRAFMEPRFGYDFSKVRVHSGAAAERSARDVSAHAYTVGHSVVFAAGRFEPGTHEGRRLLAHELTHVAQQASVATLQRQPATASQTAQSGGPVVKDILRLNESVPIKGLVKNQPNYIDHFSGHFESAPLGPDITFFPRTGPASQTGTSIPKGDFLIDADPLSGFSIGQNQVYKSRAIAEAVVTDLMKQAPDVPTYAYYLQDGIIFPTTLSDTTVPNLMPFIRQKREQDLEDINADAELARAVLWWYVGARFPIKIRSGGGAAAGKEAAKQLEKEAAKQLEKEAVKGARELAKQMAAKQGKVVVNLGGTGEVTNAINVNPLTAQQVKDVPNLVRAGAEKVGSLFKPGTVDKIVSNDVVRGTVNWAETAQGSFSALKSGGQVSIAPYAGSLAEHLSEIQAALKAAGFKDVKVIGGHIITAVKP